MFEEVFLQEGLEQQTGDNIMVTNEQSLGKTD